MNKIPFHFEGMAMTKAELAGGLRALADVQGIVSNMVAGALPADGSVPPINVLTYGFALMKEVTELMDEISWKPWKPRKPIDKARVADEFADILAFLGLMINYLMRLANISAEDLALAYLRKSDVNVARFSGEVPEYVMKEA